VISNPILGCLIAFFTGSAAVAAETFYLLQEDGASKFTLEDGTGFLLLETAP
jgi:L-lactate permease